MGEQGIVPSNYVEVVAGLPPAPLPQAPPGYSPQAAVPYGAPQQLGMPQQQVPMQQQMPMVANTNANTNTTVVNIQGAVAGPAFVNPGGAQCHQVRCKRRVDLRSRHARTQPHARTHSPS